MTKTRGVWLQLAIAAIVALTLVRLIAVSERYPYYFVWDLDHTTELDTLLINSGLLPDHLGHPGFGMYLLLTTSEKAARAAGAISIATLDDVEAALNPIAGMAERTDYLRRHTPFVCIAIVLMLWAALRLMFRLPWWCVLLFLLLLASQESLTYHASMIRTEIFSVLFWSAATLAAAIVARATTAWSRDVGYAAVGLMLGLSFLTKVQALFYLAATICILLLFRSLAGDAEGVEYPAAPPVVSRRRDYALAGVCLLNITLFLVLAVFSVVTHIPAGVATFSVSQGVTPVAIAIGLEMVALLGVHLMSARGRRIPFDGARIAGVLTVITAGFFLAFALHFVIMLSPAAAWRYLVYDFKMLFVRKTFYQVDGASFLGALTGFVAHNPLVYLTHVALLAGLAAGRASRTIRVSREQLFWCAAASAMAFVNLGLGSRFILRDAIWAETLVNFLSLVYLAMIATRAEAGRRTVLTAAGATLAAVMVLVNGVLSSTMTTRIDANFNQYGWDAARWASEVYEFNQPRYTAIIERKYDTASLAAALHAGVDHEAIRRTAAFVFPSQSPNHRNIGLAAMNMPVWGSNQRYRIARLPPGLEGAIVVDPSSLPNSGRPLFTEAMVRGESEYFDKFRRSSSADLLPVLTRRDLRVLMFVRPGDEPAFQSAFIAPAALSIALRSGGDTIEMQGLEVTNYSEVPFRFGSERYFFVIVQR